MVTATIEKASKARIGGGMDLIGTITDGDGTTIPFRVNVPLDASDIAISTAIAGEWDKKIEAQNRLVTVPQTTLDLTSLVTVQVAKP